MKKYFKILLAFFLIACNSNEKENALILKEQELEQKINELNLKLQEIEDKNQENQIEKTDEKIVSTPIYNGTKYVYAYFEVLRPRVEEEKIQKDKFGFDYEYVYGIYMDEVTYASDVEKVDNYNEDKKYMFLDNVRCTLPPGINVLSKYRESKSSRLQFSSQQEADILSGKYNQRILKENVLVFDTYKEASISRNKRLNITP